MAQERRPNGEEFDLRLEWPRDGLIEPLEPSAWRQSGGRDDAELEPPAAGEESGADKAAHPEVDDTAPEGESAGDSQRRAVLRILEPSVTDLVRDFEALVSTMSTFRDVVSGHLHGYVEEVELMETVSTGYLKEYRDAHVRALTDLRRVVGDNPAWAQWLGESVKEMTAAVDDAAQSLRDFGNDARQGVARSDDAVDHMTDAVRWLGEQLQTSLRELRSVVAPAGADANEGALAESWAAVARGLSRLAEAGEGARAGERETSMLALAGDPRIEKQLARLTEEVRTSRALDESLFEDLLAKLREQQSALGDEGLRKELGRMADEIQALRRRLGLRAKAQATLDAEQLDAIAEAVVSALGGSSTGSVRRRPLEARRTPSTTSRRPRD